MRNLLATKLRVPAPAGDVTVRRRLLAQLNRGPAKKLTLICAPAGFGKTTLVALWLHSLIEGDSPDRSALRATWYTIDATDDDLATFVSYLVAAIRIADADALADWVDLDRRPGAPTPEALTTELAQAGEHLTSRLIVVLDDYHFITNPEIHRLVGHLLRHLPPALHLVITARHDPPLGLSQLRARDQINELRAHHLAFSMEETDRFFFDTLGVAIEPDILAALWERTEGWAVGLRLAAISLQASEDRRRFIDHFRQHSSRYIIDYLVDEVLCCQPPETHDFLLHTSILGRLSAELCAAVLNIEPLAAQGMLAYLERNNLFVAPLDDHREWYRYHSQFQTMLGNRLRGHEPAAQIAALHSRAAVWLAAHDLVAEALPHYLAAGDPGGAAALVERHIPEMLNRERWSRLAGWLALLPGPLIERRPALLLLRAWVYIYDFKQVQIRPLVEQAERLLRSEEGQASEAAALWGQIYTLRASTIFASGPTDEVIAYAEEALRLLPSSYVWVRSYALGYLAQWRLARGDCLTARQMIEAEMAAAGPALNEYLVRLYYTWSVITYLAGSLDEFQRAAARYEAAARQLDMLVDLKWAQWGLGIVHLERNELEPALAYMAAVVTRPELAHFQTLRLATFALLEVYADQGRAAEALAALAALRGRLGADPDPNNLHEVEALEAYWALLSGDLAAAGRWARTTTPEAAVFNLASRAAIHVRIYLALGGPADLEQATGLALRLLEEYRRLHNVGAQPSILALLARAYWQRQMPRPALAALREALTLGYPRGWRHVFTEHGAIMAEMLRVLAREPQFADAASSLLAELGRLGQVSRPWRQHQAGGELVVEPLTERETDVLRLLSGGLSNKEIAYRLGISPITVRNHTVNIYDKLHVESRRQAVSKAQQLGLLRP